MANLDEDGRCITTELFPEQCACKWHRDVKEEKEDDDITFDVDSWGLRGNFKSKTRGES